MISAEFFNDKSDAGKDLEMIKMKAVGDPNDVIQKVGPDHVRQFPKEYAAFKQGSKRIDHGGTRLLDVPGIDRDAEIKLNFQGVYNAEHLAGLTDGQVSSLGKELLTLRRTAQLLIAANKTGKKDAA